jgi:hypothetical protein
VIGGVGSGEDGEFERPSCGELCSWRLGAGVRDDELGLSTSLLRGYGGPFPAVLPSMLESLQSPGCKAPRS